MRTQRTTCRTHDWETSTTTTTDLKCRACGRTTTYERQAMARHANHVKRLVKLVRERTEAVRTETSTDSVSGRESWVLELKALAKSGHFNE